MYITFIITKGQHKCLWGPYLNFSNVKVTRFCKWSSAISGFVPHIITKVKNMQSKNTTKSKRGRNVNNTLVCNHWNLKLQALIGSWSSFCFCKNSHSLVDVSVDVKSKLEGFRPLRYKREVKSGADGGRWDDLFHSSIHPKGVKGEAWQSFR